MELEAGLRNEAHLLTIPPPTPASPGARAVTTQGIWPGCQGRVLGCSHTEGGGSHHAQGLGLPSPPPRGPFRRPGVQPSSQNLSEGRWWGTPWGTCRQGLKHQGRPWILSTAEQSPVLLSFHQAGAALIQPVRRGCGDGGSGVLGQGSSCTERRVGGRAPRGSQLPWTSV